MEEDSGGEGLDNEHGRPVSERKTLKDRKYEGEKRTSFKSVSDLITTRMNQNERAGVTLTDLCSIWLC